MLSKHERSFTVIFLILVILELIFVSIESLSQFEFISKPAIVISIMIFFWMERHSVSGTIANLTLIALLFSLIGDVLLMFVDQSPNYFMFGLVAFLLAHITYIIVFLKNRNPSYKPIWIMGILDIYALSLFLFLKDYLGDLMIPVLIYILIILGMATSAFLRKGGVSKLSYNFVILGAILFMVSDSLLAVNKFYQEIPFANIFIMLTYAIAQYFIVIGIKKAS